MPPAVLLGDASIICVTVVNATPVEVERFRAPIADLSSMCKTSQLMTSNCNLEYSGSDPMRGKRDQAYAPDKVPFEIAR